MDNANVAVTLTETVINLVDNNEDNENMGVLTSGVDSELKVDITVAADGKSGVADTITVAGGSKGYITLSHLEGMADADDVSTLSYAIVKIIIREDGSISEDANEALQLVFGEELLKYNREYDMDSKEYNDGTSSTVYATSFIGKTGIELAEHNTALKTGVLEQRSTLKEANIYGGASDNKVRTYIVKSTETYKYTIAQENVDLGETGSGVFNVFGYKTEKGTKEKATYAVIDLGGNVQLELNPEENVYVDVNSNNLYAQVRHNGFNLVNATTINIKDLTIQNAEKVLILNNESAVANISNVIFTGNIRAIENTVGVVTLTNSLVNEGMGIPNDIYNASTMTINGSTVNSLLTNTNSLTIVGTTLLSNVYNDSTGVMTTSGDTTNSTITDLTNRGNVMFEAAVDYVSNLVNYSNVVSNSQGLTIDNLVNNQNAKVQLLSSNDYVVYLANNGVVTTEGVTKIDELYNEGEITLNGSSSDERITDHIVYFNNKIASVLTSTSKKALFEEIDNEGRIHLNGQLDTVRILDNKGIIETSNETAFGARRNSSLNNTGSITLNGVTSLIGTVSGNGTMTLNDSINLTGVINAEQKLLLSQKAILTINNGLMNFNESDEWLGNVTLSLGTLNYNDLTTNGVLFASGGSLNITNSTLNLIETSYINSLVSINLKNNAILAVNGGLLEYNQFDIWNGKIVLSSGEMRYSNTKQNAMFEATGGLLLLDNATLTLFKDDNILRNDFVKSDVVVNISENSNIILTGGTLELNANNEDVTQNDTWAGLVTGQSGNLYVSNLEITNKNLAIADNDNENVNINLTKSIINLVDVNSVKAPMNLGELVSGNDSELKVDIWLNEDSSEGLADTIVVAKGSKGFITLSQLEGMPEANNVTLKSYAIIEIITRSEHYESIDENETLQLVLADKLIEKYNREYNMDSPEYNPDGTHSTVYANSFIGKTGIELAEYNTAIKTGVLEQRSTLKEANIYGGESDNETRTYFVKGQNSSKYTLVREHIDLGETGSGLFNVFGYEEDQSSQERPLEYAKLSIIDFAGGIKNVSKLDLNPEETLYDSQNEVSLEVEERHNGFNLVYATTINVRDLTIQNANKALSLDNASAVANISNVIFTGNIRAIENTVGAVTLT
ncbi:hypothetical protein IKJ53_07025, partial [bacterium]|nr:hypothetical protein [bacterium]